MAEWEYMPAQDRFDVAIRTVAKLAQGKLRVRGVNTWTFLESLGLNRKEHEYAIVDGLDRVDSLHTDAGLAVFLKYCPYVLSAALELLRLYAAATYTSRRNYYAANSQMRENGDKTA